MTQFYITKCCWWNWRKTQQLYLSFLLWNKSTNKKRLLPRNQMLILVWTFLMPVSVTKLVVKLQAAVNQDPLQTLINHWLKPQCIFVIVIVNQLFSKLCYRVLSSSWTVHVVSCLSTTQIEYSNKVDTNVTTENCTFIGISKMLLGGVMICTFTKNHLSICFSLFPTLVIWFCEARVGRQHDYFIFEKNISLLGNEL